MTMIKAFFSSAFVLIAVATLSGGASAVEVDDPWVRPTPPGAKVAGAFMTLRGGHVADRLVSASSPAAAVVELHTHVMEAGVAKMRAVPAIELPANGKVELKPGGLHIMLINLKAPLKAGDIVPIRLRFEQGHQVEVNAAVRVQAPSPANQGGHSGHGAKHSH